MYSVSTNVPTLLLETCDMVGYGNVRETMWRRCAQQVWPPWHSSRGYKIFLIISVWTVTKMSHCVVFFWLPYQIFYMECGLSRPLTEMSIRNISCGIKRPVRKADSLITFVCWLSWNVGASAFWKPQGLSRLVQGLLYLYIGPCTGTAVPLYRSLYRDCCTFI